MRAVKKAYHANCRGPLVGNAVDVTSIQELTYRTFADIGCAIAEVGDGGYSGVELVDGDLLEETNQAELCRSLTGAGIKLIAAYSGANFFFPTLSTKSSPALGEGDELSVIAAAVLGGASLFGGAGTVVGSVVA